MTDKAFKLYLAIGLGGMIGAVGRYSISLLFVGGNEVFPFATLLANLIGCFLLSYLLNQAKLKQIVSPEIITALSVGVIGAFTTYSTFAIETILLWNHSILMAFGYVFASIIGGIGLCYCGYYLAVREVD